MTTQPATFAEWFAAEIDQRLAGKSPAEAAAYLAQQHHYWTFRFADFVGSQGKSECDRPHPDYGVPTMWDFRMFMSEIEVRISRLEKAVAA